METGRSSSTFRWGLGEWTGAMGDAGTFIPLYLALVALCGLPPARPLLLVGAAYIASALYFRLPVPVQPLKAVAALCVARGLGAPMLAAAGLWMGLVMLALAATGLVERMSRYFTPPIVKGIQLGVGLTLVQTGVTLILVGPPHAHAARAAAGTADWGQLVSALWLLVVPQLPLTLGNSVFALHDAARGYFGDDASRMTSGKIAASVGSANLLMAAFGGMPICHGSGGLTAHYRFGSRTAGSTVIAGGFYILLALAFAGRAHKVLELIPPSVLGAMIVYAGICHALLMRDLKSKRAFALALGLIGLATGNLAYALGAGLAGEGLMGLMAGRTPTVSGKAPSGTPCR